MNQHQKKYALERIEGLMSIKLRKAKEKFTSKEVKLTDEQAYKLIATGKVKIHSFDKIHNNRYHSPNLYSSFDFSSYEKQAILDNSKYDPIDKKIRQTAQKAKDQIMLGDCAEALKFIQELEDITV